MANKDPLHLVLKLAVDAEEQTSVQFRSASMEVQKVQSQLDALNKYRLDYMSQMNDKVGTNLSSSQYQQFHKFIAQIDQAVSQQVEAVKQAETFKLHRQKHWLEKQQKRKAVEILIDKKAQKLQMAEAKAEQKLFDEFAVQQYFRKNM